MHNLEIEIFVPGRICLFGEHSDWAAGYRIQNPNISPGYAIVVGTNNGIYAKCKKHSSLFTMHSIFNDSCTHSFHSPLDRRNLLQIASTGGKFSYVAGAVFEMITKYPVGGIIIDNYRTTLPIKKGQSSSASICVMVVRAFNLLYELNLTVQEEMDLAYSAEHHTPSQCGRLDQCVAFGSKLVHCKFDVIVDLCAQKDTCKILSSLNSAYPYPNTNYHEVHNGLHLLLGPINESIVNQALNLLQTGGDSMSKSIGKLMSEAQKKFDQHATSLCPDELTAPILHQVLNYKPIQSMIYGGKGVGSQGDGTCQLVCRSKVDQEKVFKILEKDLHMNCSLLTIEQRI